MPDYRMTAPGVCAVSVARAWWPEAIEDGLAALRKAIWLSTQASHATTINVPGQESRLAGRRSGAGNTFHPAPPETHPDSDAGYDPADGAERGEIWDIVQRAQQGDAEAFGQIYDRYLDTVYRYIFFRVGGKALAEDLTSETFLRALRRIGSVTWQGRDLGAWLVTIARNLIADHYKSGRYRLEVATADMVADDHVDTAATGAPEAQVIDRLTNHTLLQAVTKLGSEQQECIVLRFLDGLSVSETAQVMGKNEGAIKALQYRAVRALARLLPEGFTA